MGGPDLQQLIDGIESGNTALLARAVSVVENGRQGFEQLLSALHPRMGRAHRIGLTGPPGAGKSTLTEAITRYYRERDLTVAVVAVDPTSPFTGGALLGDRIRMESVSMDEGVFIRSMASRGAAGGLATTTREVCDLLDAFGFDRIIIETVGVGQSELAVAATADTAGLVLVPEAGDGIQVLKAGVMEIADIFCINKADRPGADKLAQEVQVMIGLRAGEAYRNMPAGHGAAKSALNKAPASTETSGWVCPVLQTSAVKNEGIPELVEAIERHAGYLRETGKLDEIRRRRVRAHVREVVERAVEMIIWGNGTGSEMLENGVNSIVEGKTNPYEVAHRIVKEVSDRWPDKDR